MSIPFGYYQGNRSEYLAIPALSKLGFTVPVPRQEDHFAVDFIVHLSELSDNVVRPTGKSFGIQIKSNMDTIAIDTREKRNCVYNSSLPFFLGVVSREDLTLKVYCTINRLRYYWMRGSDRDFRFIFDESGDGLPIPHHEEGEMPTGKPILVIDIGDPGDAASRVDEIKTLQATMESWIELEKHALSLKEREIPMVFWPSSYTTNAPLGQIEELSHSVYASLGSLPNICKATELTLTSLLFYLDKLDQSQANSETPSLLKLTHVGATQVKQNCQKLREAVARSS